MLPDFLICISVSLIQYKMPHNKYSFKFFEFVKIASKLCILAIYRRLEKAKEISAHRCLLGSLE